MDQPCTRNGYLRKQVDGLLSSFALWTGKDLVPSDVPTVERARQLFYAPFVVLSHNAAPEPVLNYVNQAGLALFEMSWEELIGLPSRRTAEPAEQAQREQLLATVAKQGYIDHYRGVRITRTGRRFVIEQATIWNIIEDDGAYCGQAAMFRRWKYLE